MGHCELYAGVYFVYFFQKKIAIIRVTLIIPRIGHQDIVLEISVDLFSYEHIFWQGLLSYNLLS